MYRQIIKAKDIQKLFGKKTRASFSILSKLRADLKKEKHHQVSISDFCAYYNINKEETAAIIHTYDLEELKMQKIIKAQKQREQEKNNLKNTKSGYQFSK